jgi:hypothetical protein
VTDDAPPTPNIPADDRALHDWSDAVALLVADALVDGGIVAPGEFARASEIIAEELWIRLLTNDRPPPPPPHPTTP